MADDRPRESDSLNEPGYNEDLGQFPRKYGAIAGLAVLAILLLLITASGGHIVFGWLAFLAAGGALALGANVLNSAAPQAASVQISTTPIPDDARRQQLQDCLSEELTFTQGRIESMAPYAAVVVYGKPVNHILHLLVSVFLCGLWIPVWIYIAASGGEAKRVLAVDACGNITKH